MPKRNPPTGGQKQNKKNASYARRVLSWKELRKSHEHSLLARCAQRKIAKKKINIAANSSELASQIFSKLKYATLRLENALKHIRLKRKSFSAGRLREKNTNKYFTKTTQYLSNIKDYISRKFAGLHSKPSKKLKKHLVSRQAVHKKINRVLLCWFSSAKINLSQSIYNIRSINWKKGFRLISECLKNPKKTYRVTKLRIITWDKRKKMITFSIPSVLAIVLIAALVVPYFFKTNSAEASAFIFSQSSWAGGVTANAPSHPTNKTNWTEYSAKSATTVAAASGVSLTQSSSSSVTDNGVVQGTLTSLATPNIVTGSLPRSVTVSSDGTSVYVANSHNGTGGNTLSMYSRNPSTGALTALSTPTIVTGNLPISVTVSSDGTSVYVANASGNTVSMYSRNTSTGALTALATPTIATGTSPYSVTVSPEGTSVYVANKIDNTVSMYSRNTSTGALTALATPTIGTGSSPVPVTVSSDGTSVYVANSHNGTGGNTLSMYSRNPSTGALTALSTPTIVTGNLPISVTVSSDGTSVYVANAYNGTGGNTLSMYSRNPSTGALTALSTPTIATGALPQSVAVSSDNTSVYVANYGYSNVSMYSRNTSTGALTALATPTIATGTSPYSVTVSSDGTSVYVANNGDNTVSMYSRSTVPGFGAGTLSSTSISGSDAAATVGLTNTPTQTTNNFAYTGSVQSWTVPAGATSATITVNGAGGGNSGTENGGAGGKSIGTLAVTPGQVYYILVGQSLVCNMMCFSGAVGGGGVSGSNYGMGGGGGGGYYGGGGGGGGYAPGYTPLGHGGGMTWFSPASTFAQGTVLLVAGGGGGAGAGTLSNGGAGGGSSGGAGLAYSGYTNAGGGTQSAGGAAGTTSYSSYTGAGAAGSGGSGGNGSSGSIYQGGGVSGGGGSGYVGGAGLTNTSTVAGTGSAAGTNGSASVVYSIPVYSSSGTFTSGVINTGAQSAFTTLSYSATLNSQTITMDARAGNTATPDGTWTDWTTGIASGGSIAALSNNRYIQYRANLSTNNPLATPTLSSVTINYGSYNSSGTLTSSIYDSNNANNILANMSWTATGTSATEIVKFQIRSAATSGGIATAAWCGPADTAAPCSGTSFFTTSTGDTIPANSPLKTGGDDRYFQYLITLSSGGTATPIVTNSTIQYDYNVPPAITGLTYTQNSDGTVTVPYTLSETYDDFGNITRGTSSFPIKTLLFWQPDSSVTSPVLTDSQTGIITLTNTNSQPIPSSGSMLIDNELITFDSAGATGNQRNILTRGAVFTSSFPTAATSHSAGAAVFFQASSAVQTVDTFSSTGTAGTTTSTSGNSFTWDPKSDSNSNLNTHKLTGMLLKVVANDAAANNNIGQSSATGAQTLDLLAPTFTMQYYSDSGLTTSLGTNPRLKAGTYYIKISANESLNSTPTISINAEGSNNDVTNGATTLVSGNDYKYTRTITSDAAAVGSVLSDVSITGIDSFSNTATSVDPTDETTKAGYTDTTAPTAAITYSTNNAVKSGTSLTITATFSESIADSPVPQISISGANTLAATNMVKTDATHYYYVDTAGAGNGTATVAISTCTDIAGNVITSAPTSGADFIVDNTAPTAAITYSTSDPVKSGASLTINATFNEDMADSPIPKIAISGANTLAATNMTKTDPTHYYYVDTVGAGNGTATVALSVGTDLATNVITSAPTSGATFTVDNTAPTTVGTATLSSYLNNTGNTNVSWTGTSDTYFKDYLVQRKTGSGGTFATLGSPITNIATISYSDNSALAENTYYYQVIAEDTAGNTATSTISSAFVVDKTAPALQSFTSTSTNSNESDPLTMYGTGDTINIQAVFNENLGNGSTMTVQLENTAQSQVLLNQISGSTLAGTYTVSGPSSGESDDSPDLAVSQIISTSISDIATNLKSTETIPTGQNLSDNKNIIVDTVPPSLQSFTATGGNYKAGDSITITAHYNKSVKAGSNIHVKINSDGGTNTIDLTTISTSTISGSYSVGASDNSQNLKVASIVSQAVADVKNNQLTDTNMPSTNIADGVLVDTTAPVITFSDDVNSSPNQSDSVTIHVVETNSASDKYIFSSDNICNNKNYTSATTFGSDTPVVLNTETNNTKYICTKSTDTAGNISYQASANALNIDITAPTGTISVNRSIDSGQIQLTSADGSRGTTGLQMRSITYNNDTSSCDLSGASWGDFASTLDLTSSSALTKACVEYKDVAGNTTILNATPPQTPASFQYFDVSDPDDFRVFLSWRIPTGHEGSKGFYQYQLFQCSDAKGNDDCTPDTASAPTTTIAQESTNYKTYLTLSDDNKYCYQIRFASHDSSGTDYSALSEKRCVVPSSASSSVTKDVAIELAADPVPNAELFANQATIHWDTVNANDFDEPLPADSQVCWRVHIPLTPPGWNCRSYESYETSHAVTISKATERLYDLMPDTEYDYQVRSRTSWGEEATMDGPTTFTTKDGPVIKNINADPIGNTTATIQWTTENKNGDALASSSSLWYASALDSDGNLVVPQEAVCDQEDVTSHNCSLSGLSIGTQYYYYLESTANSATDRDTANGDFYRFTTLSDSTPPAITANPGNPLIVTDTQAALSWETDERSNAWLLYDTTTHTSFDNFVDSDFDPTSTSRNPYSSYLAGDSSNLAHTFIMNLDSLAPSTTYYYRMVSQDTSENLSVSAEQSFTTLPIQKDHPALTNPGNPLVAEYSDTEAVIYLPAANTEATSKVCWATNTITDMSSCTNHSEINTATKSHYYHLTNLTPDTTYHLMTKISDSETAAINFTSSDITFKTRIQTNQNDPLTEITDIQVPTDNLSDTNAVATFVTDQPALCLAELTIAQGSYTNPVIINEDGYDQRENYSRNHNIRFINLIFSTPYYFKVTCHDNLKDDQDEFSYITSDEHSFTTEDKQISESSIGGSATDATAPTIANISSGSITGENSTIQWTTDEDANSLIRFGITTDYGNMAGNDLVNSSSDNYVTDHSVIINNLTPSTKYYYKVLSADASGNISEASEQTFTTKAPSSLSSIKFVSTSLSEVNVTWDTSTAMNSVVEYGISTDYGDSKSSSTETKSHSTQISGLKTGTIYHFRVKGQDADNNIYSSGDYTFQPKSPPKVSGANVDSISEHTAKITINTDIPADALITYSEKLDPTSSGSQGKPDFATKHIVNLANLKSGTTYVYFVKVSDEQGNQTTSDAKEFTTSKDEIPPVLDNVHSESALTQSDKVQTIISFKTDEPATAKLFYKEGRNGEEKESDMTVSVATSHVAVITSFKSGTVYNFKVTATDASGNTSTSESFSLLTPVKKENVIQIITSNFQDIFGWLSR